MSKERPSHPAGKCRICGCTDFNACINGIGGPCHWIEPDLCSACTSVLSHASRLIREERRRQISVEGYGAAHDDRHDDGCLLRAAVIYLWHGTPRAAPVVTVKHQRRRASLPLGWPWRPKYWRPRDRKSNLVRAGALCVAENDRRRRASMALTPSEHKLAIVIRELARVLAAEARA